MEKINGKKIIKKSFFGTLLWGTLINSPNIFISGSLDGLKGLFFLFVEGFFGFPYLVVFIGTFIIFFFRNRNEIKEKKGKNQKEYKREYIIKKYCFLWY